MSKSWDKKVILQKIETVEGTDSAPVVGTNALKVRNYQPTFMTADAKPRAFEKAFLGADPVVLAAFKRGASFELEMAGSGTAVGVPPWMVANRIAGFDAGVVNGTTSVIQTPVSVIPSSTHYGYIDDLLLAIVGARASMGFTITDDDYPFFNYTLLGRAPTILGTEGAPGTPTLTGYIDPVISATENTTFLLDTYALPLRSWTMNANVDLQYRSLIGPQDRVMARQRSWSGTIVAELPQMATKDYFAKIRPGTTMVAQCVQGNVTGNIVQVDCPKLQITGDVALSEEQGQVMVTFPVTALPNIGNDEILFTSK